MRKLMMLFALVLSMNGRAQELYPQIPDFAWDMIMDRVDNLNGRLLATKKGQYLGQVDREHILTGFGFYIDAKDNQRIGLFRNGAFIYGVTLTQTSAIVGTPDEFACYSLTTSKLEYVKKGGETFRAPDGAPQFVSAMYENGDRYIGEYKNGRRDGFGIYYYASGDFWFGQYKNGQRDGFGCLYGHDYVLLVGQWKGEKVLRQTVVRCE